MMNCQCSEALSYQKPRRNAKPISVVAAYCPFPKQEKACQLWPGLLRKLIQGMAECLKALNPSFLTVMSKSLSSQWDF